MQNMVLSPIDPEKLIQSISEKVAAKIIEAVFNESESKSNTKDLLTVQEAGDFLSLSVPTIYSKVSRGELPVMKQGKRLYFSRAELLEFLKAGRKKTNAEIQEAATSYLKTNKKGVH